MAREPSFLILTGVLFRDQALSLVDPLHKMGFCSSAAEVVADTEDKTRNLQTLFAALSNGDGHLHISPKSSPSSRFQELKKLLAPTGLSWSFQQSNIMPLRVTIHDAPSGITHRLPWVSGEIGLTASQAECATTRASILTLRKYLTSGGLAVVESHHQILDAIKRGLIPEDHLSPALTSKNR